MTPKFRAWDPYYKKMFTNEQVIVWNGNVYINDSGKISADKLRGWSIDEKYLMQSTDKMDATGQVEVYDGDILYYPDQDEDNYGIIKFDEDTLAFVLDNGNENFIYGDYGMGKVIGNIHQNKDLVAYIHGNIWENPDLVEEING